MREPIFVTRPSLPPLAELIPYLEEIWESRNLTNGGPFHQRLELELCRHLGVPQISLFCNGTIALLCALKALRVTGEVITTPYSFVATSHSLLWNDLKPVFVDIDERTLNIDPNRIEAAITSETTAILATHCYGNPCDVLRIQEIANAYNLKVIYDAAHAFGVQVNGHSVLNYGDLSILSFHATKVFNTFEGGAIVSQNEKVKAQIDDLKNFGFLNQEKVVSVGINGKMNEFSAALGLLQLQEVDKQIAERKIIYEKYHDIFDSLVNIKPAQELVCEKYNYAYMPARIRDTGSGPNRDMLFHELGKYGIHCRKYFYPLITEFPMYRGLGGDSSKLQTSRSISGEILCFPIFPDLDIERVKGKLSAILGVLNNRRSKFYEKGADARV
jgi:dTDP-4-amino-4,6-dideoxygalactose transaminase